MVPMLRDAGVPVDGPYLAALDGGVRMERPAIYCADCNLDRQCLIVLDAGYRGNNRQRGDLIAAVVLNYDT